MLDSLEQFVGSPFRLHELKHKPGRRRTLSARGPLANAIVKLYESDRAPVVARRIAAIAEGPHEPLVPTVLHVDPSLHLLVLSEVPGTPLRDALLDNDLRACARAGAALGGWHAAWSGTRPDGLRAHTAARELEILARVAASASAPLARLVLDAMARMGADWTCDTVVHRDLYEEQLVVGERIGLIDLDDAALGPPELDVGNLLAHVELLERRRRRDLVAPMATFVDGYLGTGPALHRDLLERCRALTLLRLACLNDDPALVEAALGGGAAT